MVKWGCSRCGNLFVKKMNLPIYSALMKRDIKIIRKLRKKEFMLKQKYSSGRFCEYDTICRFCRYRFFSWYSFLTNFREKFVAINERIEDKMKNDERILSILQRIGLEDRYLTLEKLSEMEEIKNIDYKEVDYKKKELCEESRVWLRDSIRKAVQSR